MKSNTPMIDAIDPATALQNIPMQQVAGGLVTAARQQGKTLARKYETAANLDLLRDAADWQKATYGDFAHFLNTTVEDLMCAKGDYLADFISRADGLKAYAANQQENQRKIDMHGELLGALEAIPGECGHKWPHLAACWVCRRNAVVSKAYGRA